MINELQVIRDDFDVEHEYQALRVDAASNGAVVMFVGLVRDFSNVTELSDVRHITLDYYAGMTEAVCQDIIDQAKQRWPVTHCRVIHRVGKLAVNEQIVFVGVASAHRHAAFDAANFIMDKLKTEAPFWKKEVGEEGEIWVDQKCSDIEANQRWKQDYGEQGNDSR